MTAELPTPVAWSAARWVKSVHSQEGWLVLHPQWVAFLPAKALSNFVVDMGFAIAGLDSLEEKPRGYELAALWRRGPDAFEKAIRASALHLWKTSQIGLVVAPTRKGQVSISLFRSDQELMVASLPVATSPLLFRELRWRRPGRAAVRQDLRWLAGLSLLPLGLGGLTSLIGVLRHEPSAVWGGPVFWGVLSLACWCAIVVRWKSSRGLPEESTLVPIAMQELPFLGEASASTSRGELPAPGPSTDPESMTRGTVLALRMVLAYTVEATLAVLCMLAMGAMIEARFGASIGRLSLVAFLPACAIYYVVWESVLGGTPALRIMGLRVVPKGADRTGKVSPGQSLARGSLLLAELLLFAFCFPVGPILLFLYRHKRGSFPHDDLSHTRVIWA